ncbi:hypothetical protein [Paenibacillus sp. 1_12]|uniref:hypothetical protein n=1 Tax=Paenibacillus sp. 1_12 TaxID=1566278 RepID=UPI0015A70B0D|nr:hypothetical protein [Paenibacillus sp. 1_12]
MIHQIKQKIGGRCQDDSRRQPMESFDEFVTMWKKQGGDKIIKEATEWYNKNGKK